MNLNLKSKTAFVSGSTRGIGFAIAKQLLLEGEHVVIHGRTQEKADRALKRLKEELPAANTEGIPADFSRLKEGDQLIKCLPEIDILVNNAGYLC